MKAYRAKAIATKKVRGDYSEQYEHLRDYALELKRENPGTTVKIVVEDEANPYSPTRQFKRIYIYIGALKDDFKACGKELLGLDGSFMKGPFPGHILTAVGVDPNQEHRFYLRHIYENMKKTWKGKVFKDAPWKCATSPTLPQFQNFMDYLKVLDRKAFEWLKDIPAVHWSRAHFTGRPHCDVLLNNMCKVFNRQLIDGCDTPIITTLEYIREYLMKRIVNVGMVIAKSEGLLTPTTTRILEATKTQVAQYIVHWNGGDKYQVHDSYRLATWKKVYEFKVGPLSGKELWPKSDCALKLTTPVHHTQVGRPKKKIRKSAEELSQPVKGSKFSKAEKSATCTKCKKSGHNSRTCKGQEAKAV
ncbi:hypothetical protein L6452_04838 [Arctium lappa]|uniref:Uncharacterized protein n=1 Tax=Arctium lappa TaxID=4217 RepID=A0ACB9EEC6_ARCLA|nr:hypothetical protein L6452_04838 [Arctium lappa]